MRWLRATWRRGWEARLGLVAGATAFCWSVAAIIGRGAPLSGSYLVDAVNVLGLTAFCGLIAWACPRAIRWLYDEGILRGR